MELLKNNYMQGSGSGDTWHVNIDPPKRKVGTYFQETLLATEYVNANRTGEIQLLYSGGLDSEYVARVLLHLGIKFTPVIIQLKNVKENTIYNDHDTIHAFKFCDAHNLKPKIYELDFDEFVMSGQHWEIAKSTTIPASVLSQIIPGKDVIALFSNNDEYVSKILSVLQSQSPLWNKVEIYN